jgi:tetratricopeptide (TPR) repeat protein
MIRHQVLAVLLVSTIAQAEIAAPPQIQSAPVTETAKSIPVEPAQAPQTPVAPQIPDPIAFDAIHSDPESDVELAPALVSSETNVNAIQTEIDQALMLGDQPRAEKAFKELLKLGAPAEQKRDAIYKMALSLEEKQNAPLKAAVLYEQFLSLYPNDPEDPNILLRLGKIYRESGSYASALNKFYSVLYTSLQLKSGNEFTDSSLRAKMEIAHTHFAMGDYKTAAQLYSRLKLIKMTQAEASEVAFRTAYIDYLSGDFTASLTAAQSFLTTYPASPLAPEAQYLVAQSLKSLGRTDEAMKETLKLLAAGREFGKKKPAIWAYWQRKTGNEIANELYEGGDAIGALSIYQKLAELDDNPNWRASTVYQIGLCFERLRHLERAREAYRFIIDKIPVNANPDSDALIGVNLATLRDMAQWRLENLTWLEQTEKDIYPLMDKPTPTPDLQPASLKPTPTNAQATPATLQTSRASTPAKANPPQTAPSAPAPKSSAAISSNSN